MDVELLSLKWNNHQTTFLHVLSNLRNKTSYADATLVCNGKFYPVHKLVLSTCSEYFDAIFGEISCKNPVIILKDIYYKNLEYLLDYMYKGDVSVKQSELSSLVNAAEYLKIKGLAIPDENPIFKSNFCNKRQSSDCQISSLPLKKKRAVSRDPASFECTAKEIDLKSSAASDCLRVPVLKNLAVDESAITHIKGEPQSDEEIIDDNILSVPDSNLRRNIITSIGLCDLDDKISNLSNDKQKVLEKSEFPISSEENITLSEPSETYIGGQLKFRGVPDDTEAFIHSVVNDTSSPNNGDDPNHIAVSSVDSTIVNLNNIEFIQFKDESNVNYRCSKCSFITIYKSSAKDHARIHTGERPFHCQYCTFTTATQYALTQHTRLHTGDTPYKCALCSYEAKQLSSLKWHLQHNHRRMNAQEQDSSA